MDHMGGKEGLYNGTVQLLPLFCFNTDPYNSQELAKKKAYSTWNWESC